MATVFIPTQMRELTDGVERLDVAGENLRQVIRELEQRWPAIGPRLRDGDGIASGLAVSIDGAFASRGLLAKVGPSSEVHFLPAIGGG